MTKTTTLLPCLLLAAATAPALADDAPPATDATAVATVEPAAAPATPPVEQPVYVPPTAPSIYGQAGSEDSPFAKKGQKEFGASAGLMLSSQFRSVMIAPAFGYFVADNFELTGIVSVSNVKAMSETSTTYTMLAEPSYHVPINKYALGFLGMGIGAAYESSLGTNLAVAPRLGAKLLIGDHGMILPSLQYSYISHSAMAQTAQTTMAMTSAMTVNIGYSAWW
jgi:hypothetical protein